MTPFHPPDNVIVNLSFPTPFFLISLAQKSGSIPSETGGGMWGLQFLQLGSIVPPLRVCNRLCCQLRTQKFAIGRYFRTSDFCSKDCLTEEPFVMFVRAGKGTQVALRVYVFFYRGLIRTWSTAAGRGSETTQELRGRNTTGSWSMSGSVKRMEDI